MLTYALGMRRKFERGDVAVCKRIVSDNERCRLNTTLKEEACALGGVGNLEATECFLADNLKRVGECKTGKSRNVSEHTLTDDLNSIRKNVRAGLRSGEEYKLGQFLVVKNTLDRFKVRIGVRNYDLSDIGTSCENAGDLGNVIGKLYTAKSGTTGECTLFKGKSSTVLRERKSLDAGTTAEGILADSLK